MAWTSNSPVLTTPAKSVPTIFTGNCTVLDTFMSSQHQGIDTATISGKHDGGTASILMVAASATIAAIVSPPSCAVAWDNDNKNLWYRGASAWINLGGSIVTGTKMIFHSEAAPVGWTIDASIDDKLLYITKGSAAGGQTGGGDHSTGTWTGTFAHEHSTNGHTLTTTQLPAHEHPGTNTGAPGDLPAGGSTTGPAPEADDPVYEYSVTSALQGGGGSHTHGNLVDYTGINTWRPAANWYTICTKD